LEDFYPPHRRLVCGLGHLDANPLEYLELSGLSSLKGKLWKQSKIFLAV
jgi:hypothetical protein